MKFVTKGSSNSIQEEEIQFPELLVSAKEVQVTPLKLTNVTVIRENIKTQGKIQSKIKKKIMGRARRDREQD